MVIARTSKNLANRERARERRLALQAEQIKRDELIDAHAGDFLDLVDERTKLLTTLADLDTQMAAKLTALTTAGGLTARETRTLLAIDAGEVKRLRALAPAVPSEQPIAGAEASSSEPAGVS